MSNYTDELQLEQPIAGDPAVKDIWGTIWDTALAMLDQYSAGILTKSVAGSSNVVLSNNQGATSESLNRLMIFTGALTGNINVLMPSGRNRFFKVINNTTGAFTLSMGVDDGGGSPAGDVVAVTQGQLASLYSDGTDVAPDTPSASGAAGGDLSGSYPNPTVTATHLSAPLPIAQGGTNAATASTARTSLGLGSAAVLDAGTAANNAVQLTAAAKLPAVDASLVTGLTASQVSGVVVPGAVTAFTKQQYFSEATLTDAANIDWNLDDAQVAKVTLGGNRTFNAPTNMKAGATYVLKVLQDGTGSRTATWNGVFRWPGGTAPTLTTTAGRMDVLTFISDGTHMFGVAGGSNYTVT